MVELRDIEQARERIGSRVHRTPLFSAATLGQMVGVRLSFKAELFQKTGSFKVRGVLNHLLQLAPEVLRNGLITLSAGNHGAALAWAAAAAGTSATVVMPATAVKSKIAAILAYGGEVIQTEGNLLEECLSIRDARGLTLVHPFDDPAIIAGQGTIGLEILEDLPDVECVIVPIGGGGLIAGIAAAIKRRRPEVRMIGVEPTGADVMRRSLAAGEPLRLERLSTVADGLAAPFAGKHTLAHVQAFVDNVVVVDDETILQALRLTLERAKLAAEPAGTAAFAALLAGAAPVPAGARVVCIVSGGNVDPAVLKRAL
ncbi:MAG: pyridoxal-phosphate dependent enzyme [Gemmatimonadetes bacterium]|nr:pyridoxal-phosphate dependent enzyme [Gemmatimonadota bacterium]